MRTDQQDIEQQYRALMNDFARMVDDIFNPGFSKGEKEKRETGFIVFAFAFGDKPGRRMNYIANCDRKDVIVALKEWIARAEGRHHEAPEKRQ